MPRTFHLDGKSHTVDPADVLVIEGPGDYTGRISGITIALKPGDTITFTFDELAPGEAITMETNVLPTTTFYRPINAADLSGDVETTVADEINR